MKSLDIECPDEDGVLFVNSKTNCFGGASPSREHYLLDSNSHLPQMMLRDGLAG